MQQIAGHLLHLQQIPFMHRHHFFLLLLYCALRMHPLMAQNCNLIPPSDLSVTGTTACSAVLHWTSATTVSKYSVFYRISGTGQWTSGINAGTATTYEFTGLLPNTKYEFAVTSKCSDGTKSKKVKISATTLKCTLPESVTLTAINSSTAKITVNTLCAFDSLTVKYLPVGGTPKTKTFAASASYTLDELVPGAAYLIRVSTCPKPISNWLIADTLFLPGKPNIILILLDDSRYDYFSCNGAPSFVQTPNIDRIANEGVNFQRAYVATSLCAPSRATIATGLFTLKTGVKDNKGGLDPSFVTIPEVLGANGYYTALVGKDHRTFFLDDIPEFEYFLESVGFEESDGTMYNYNGVQTFINKKAELTFTDTALALIQRVEDPLFLWLSYRISHIPIEPLPGFDGYYDGYQIPWKPDTAKYTVNYPSYLYGGLSQEVGVLHGYTLDTTYRSALESIAGLDSLIGEIFELLESTDKLENTLIIFMSDNGYMMGSHWLEGKTHAYEPSIRTPLFLRYPQWFAPGSTIKDQFATNMDIAPTVYEAAGINYEGSMDGKSLRTLYEGTFSRQEFYYLMYHTDQAGAPIKRSFRDQYYKYIHYTCNADTVEEFFDMINDSLEINNLVNNSAYQSILSQYHIKYDSMRIAWQDTIPGNEKDCYIENPFVLKQLFDEAESEPLKPVVYPTITNAEVELYIPWKSAAISLYNSKGMLLSSWVTDESYSMLSLGDLPDDIYMISFRHGNQQQTEKVVVVH